MQFFECFPESLGEEEVDEDYFESEPCDVDDEVFPVDGVEADGVDKGA